MDWELAVGIAGLAVSLIGFPLTIIQLLRTSRATEAVKAAILNLKNRMSAFDYSSECLRAGKSIEHAVRLLRLRQWADAAAILVEVQASLHRLSVSQEGQSEAKARAKETSDLLLLSINDLEAAFEKDLDFNSRELITILRKQGNQLDAEVISMNKELYDV